MVTNHMQIDYCQRMPLGISAGRIFTIFGMFGKLPSERTISNIEMFNKYCIFENFLLPYCKTTCANVAIRCNLFIAVGSTNSYFPNRWPKEVRTMTGTPIFGISSGRCFVQTFYLYKSVHFEFVWGAA